MDDLISRKALIDYIKNWDIGCGIGHDQKTFLNAIEEQPSVKKRCTGYWRESDGIFYCSECNNGYKDQPTLLGRPMFEYCPICGTKMQNKFDKLIDAFCRTGRYESEPLKQYGIDLSKSFGNTEQVEIVPEEEWREIEGRCKNDRT